MDVKVGYLKDQVVFVMPQSFDHCRAISPDTGIPIKGVSDYVTAEAYKKLDATG